MRKIFISYKFSGEDIRELKEILGLLISKLRDLGNFVYCSIEDESWFYERKKSNREILDRAFEKLDESDLVIVFVNSQEKSEGMLLEIGYSLAKNKKIISLIRKGVKMNFLPEFSENVIEFEDINDLVNKIETTEI